MDVLYSSMTVSQLTTSSSNYGRILFYYSSINLIVLRTRVQFFIMMIWTCYATGATSSTIHIMYIIFYIYILPECKSCVFEIIFYGRSFPVCKFYILLVLRTHGVKLHLKDWIEWASLCVLVLNFWKHDEYFCVFVIFYFTIYITFTSAPHPTGHYQVYD